MRYPSVALAALEVPLHDPRGGKQGDGRHRPGIALGSTPRDHAAVADEKPVNVVGLKIGAHDGGFRVGAHNAGAWVLERLEHRALEPLSRAHLKAAFIVGR